MAELTTDAAALSSEGWFVADSFGFGVEREMKESGEKGGTEDTSGQQASTFIIEFDRPVDPSPLSTGDLADWQDNYGTGDAAGGIATAQLTITGTISDSSAVDGRYSFAFDGNADTSGGHTQPYGDFLGGVFVGQDSNALTSVEPSAAYFDGRFLTAHDLTREQVYVSETGFDLV